MLIENVNLGNIIACFFSVSSEVSVAMSQFEKTKPISKTEDRKQKTAKSWQKIQPTFSTMVEKPLQIGTILKNKANLPEG